MNSIAGLPTEVKATYETLANCNDIQSKVATLKTKIADTEEILSYIPNGIKKIGEEWETRLATVYGRFLKKQIDSLDTRYQSIKRDSERYTKHYRSYAKAKELNAEYVNLIKDTVEKRIDNYRAVYGELLRLKNEFKSHSPQMKAVAESVFWSIPDTIEEKRQEMLRTMMYEYNYTAYYWNCAPYIAPLYNTDWDKVIKDIKSKFSIFSRGKLDKADVQQLIKKADLAFNRYRAIADGDTAIVKAWLKQCNELNSKFETEANAYIQLCKKHEEKVKNDLENRKNRELECCANATERSVVDSKYFTLIFNRETYPLHIYSTNFHEKLFVKEYEASVDYIKSKVEENTRRLYTISTERNKLHGYLHGEFNNVLSDFLSDTGTSQKYSFARGTVIDVDRINLEIPDNKDLISTFKAKTGFALNKNIFIDLFENANNYRKFENSLKAAKDEVTLHYSNKLAELKAEHDSLLQKYETQKHATTKRLLELQHQNPAIFGFTQKEFSADEIAQLIENIQRSAAKHYSLPWIINPFASLTGHKSIPETIRWQEGECTPNLNFIYQDAKQKVDALQCMNEVLVNILIAFKVKDVRLTFIDTTTSNDGAFFTTRLGSKVCNIVNRETEVRHLCEQWQVKASMVGKYCSELVPYNVANSTMLTPYDIVVLLGKQSNSIEAQLEPFIENGHKYGLYFFNFSDQNILPAKSGLFRDFSYCGSPLRSLMIKNPLEDTELTEAIFTYINTQAQKETAVQAISQDITELAQTPYGDAITDFAVPVGEVNGHDIHFKLSNQHIHSFVIGQTGQGKSVFLHDVIAGSILNYSPEQFQIYLLDFKLAGEELYHYKDVKHVRALLANGSDLKVTFEVLNNLKEQMQERSNLMRDSGARTLEEYNETALQKIPRILLVVDECQELFRDSAHRKAGDASVMIDIRNIVEDIARKGRSQGVHLLFATQTLSGTQLPAVIKNNITDYFIFKCAHEDAEQLVLGSSKKVQQLKVGHLLYTSCDGESVFHSYLPDVAGMVEEALRKSAGIQTEHDRFVFDGNNQASLDSTIQKQIIADTRKSLCFSLGRSSDLKQNITGGTLKKDFAENILFVGYNHAQTVRASFNALLSMMISNKAGALGYEFYCLDILKSEEDEISLPLEYLSRHGLKILSQSQSGDLIAELAQNIRNGNAQKCVLLILGQERFRAVRDEYEIRGQETAAMDAPRTFGRPQTKTYRSELKYILENGPELGVHTLLQIDKLSNLLFEGNISSRFVYRMFGYVCLLRCEKETEMRLSLEGVYPHQLSEEDANLGAWFIDDTNGSKEKFTPFAQVTNESITNLLNM